MLLPPQCPLESPTPMILLSPPTPPAIPLPTPMPLHSLLAPNSPYNLLLAPWHHLHYCHLMPPETSTFHDTPETQCPWAPCTPWFPLHPMLAPWHPFSQNRNLVVKSGTTAGEHDMLSTCGSGCCFVTCTSCAIVFSFQVTILMSIL